METPLDEAKFAARFDSYVEAETLRWVGQSDSDGYDIFTTAGPSGKRFKFRAHRVM